MKKNSMFLYVFHDFGRLEKVTKKESERLRDRFCKILGPLFNSYSHPGTICCILPLSGGTLEVSLKETPFQIELGAGAPCSIRDSCLPETRGFALLIH